MEDMAMKTDIRNRKKHISITVCILIVGVLSLGLTSCNSKNKKNGSESDETDAYEIASPVYPDMPSHPEVMLQNGEKDNYEAYNAALQELKDQPEGYTSGYDEYLRDIVPVIFSDQKGENLVFSPLGLYMMLGMTTEITDGSSRQQILNIVHLPDLLTMRSHAKSIFQANYMDDGVAKLILADSLWLNSKNTYDHTALDILAQEYYASSFSGDPASDEYNEALRKWVSKETDGLLDSFTPSLGFDSDMYLTLASIVNYNGKWTSAFQKELNKNDTFHAASGDVTCEFMQTDSVYRNYYGDHFSCVALDTIENGTMRFILPEEGMTPEELLKDEETLSFLGSNTWEKTEDYAGIYLTVPKFDISSDLQLQDKLAELGMTDAFDPAKADFSPLNAKDQQLYISSIIQDTRVMIDEEGCKAASLTIEMIGAGEPAYDFYFTVDRPFVFEIVSATGLPLFIGIVNDPS